MTSPKSNGPAGQSIRPNRPAVNAWSADYLDEQYEAWLADPASVAPDMASFFRGFDLARTGDGRPATTAGAPAARAQVSGGASPDDDPIAVHSLVRAYRASGHLCAELDPFGREREGPASLTPQYYGLTEANLDRTYVLPDFLGGEPMTLRDIIEVLDETYCRTMGVEFMHLESDEERLWWRERCESTRNRPDLSRAERVHVLYQLYKAEMFETFLHKRYIGQKRFSLEGAESLIALLDRFTEVAAEDNVEEVVMGMAHRGRLNVLNNILGKTYEQIFTEFEENWQEDFVDGGGDVKYHLGYSGDRETRTGRRLRIVMASNPSHLESVNGVVQGRCRAKQRLRSDENRDRTIAVQLHGDAAVIAQGGVIEVLNYSQLPGYMTGGTVHIVVNNLIGFTTGPEDARSSRYCTDVAKTIDTPVLHVNGEDPEAVVHAAVLAFEYRQRFKKDVFIDLWCYRKWGHNEGDDPSFTQPIMAALIKKKPSTLKVYAERLLSEGVISEQDVEDIRQNLDDQMERAQSKAASEPSDPTIDPGSWRWQGKGRDFSFDPVETGSPREALEEVARVLSQAPEGFNQHKTLSKLLAKRTETILEGKALDWGSAEMLAYGALLLEGNAVRISGQDSRRGTFSHRHAALRDTETGALYIPLNHMREMGRPGVEGQAPGDPGAGGKPRQARLCIYDSPLSEAGVLAFEYGYSLADPNMLVIWEAQFGDFCNGAQVIIDQYLASAELKWQRWSGLTLLLPHSYEGQGPEHSSARMERFLMLCADDNMQVVYPTTPAQCFHMLRRQLRRPFRKPLIVMSPKSLLRRAEATSAIEELVTGSFRELIDDPRFDGGDGDRRKVQRVVYCSGKVYYDLAERRDEIKRKDIALVRVEQLYPLHADLLAEIDGRYPEGAERVWVQEEPRNAGAYLDFNSRVQQMLDWAPLPYIGRQASATPATGSKKQHAKEQDEILTDAVGPAPKGDADPSKKPEKVAAG
jgi:2-oxoglutarate dehydrogenase E1 component